MNKKKMKFVVAGAVIVVAIGSLVFFGVQKNMVYYRTVAELKAGGPTENVKVSGELVSGTLENEGIGDTLKFEIRDIEKTDEKILVSFTGQVPDTCLLYTSDAADDLTRVDLGGRRIIKKKKKK